MSLQENVLLILGPRRTPALPSPVYNTYTSLAVNTPYGYRQLEISDYVTFSSKLRPDIIVAAVDHLVADNDKLGFRRKDRMGERSAAWVKAAQRADSDGAPTAARNLWAPILPIPQEIQRSYLEHLEASGPDAFGGMAVYDDASALDIPATLGKLPRLSLSASETPQALLRAIDFGIDMFAVTFIGMATDSGIALTFVFPAPSSSPPTTGTRMPLGFSLWDPANDTDTSPLVAGCTCYACGSHHRAYVRHLLNTKEMLAWVLLQIHNHHQLDLFFAGIRQSIAKSTFVDDVAAFTRIYADNLPADGGDGPRLRGYQVRKASAGPQKTNKPAYKQLRKVDLEAIEAAKALKRSTKLDDEAQKLAEAVEQDLVLPEFMT